MSTIEKGKHTAGPWQFKHTAGHNTHGQTAVYVERDGCDVALIYDGDANAELIAAAPDMLSALKIVQLELLDMADAAGDDEHWNKGGSAYEALRIVFAAIAKAEGRS